MSPTGELFQIPFSNDGEVVRWALDYKGVPHDQRNILPGPHKLYAWWLSGYSLTPVMRFLDPEPTRAMSASWHRRPCKRAVVAGSARILEELEARYPSPSLYPSDPLLRRRALFIQRWFHKRVGPAVCRALVWMLLADSDYLSVLCTDGHRPLVRRLYRVGFSTARGVMKRRLGINRREAIDAAFVGSEEGLDFVAQHAGPGGYLAGDNFTAADLTAAALLASTANPPGSPMAFPEPLPPALERWFAWWAKHPGVPWVLEQYRNHRLRTPEATGIESKAPTSPSS